MTWFIICLVATITIVAQRYYTSRLPGKNSDWRKLPFLAEYLLKHPECKINDENVRCYHCQSENILFQPLSKHPAPRYKYVCLNCKCMLFKSKFII